MTERVYPHGRGSWECELRVGCPLCRVEAGAICVAAGGPTRRPHRVRIVLGAVGYASEDAVTTVICALANGERARERARRAQIARILAERSPRSGPDPAS